MSSNSASNKRIAKNTLFLYFRMAIIMIVKLYTSRVLLNTLGIDDYGTWNVVAAFVISFSFISTPLVTATQRFLNFEMGKGGKRLNEIFCTSFELFLIIGVIIVIALETFGLWFVNTKMSFSPDKMYIVNWTFQFAIFSLFLNLIKMPYESSLIANERMSFYAIICIIEACILLGIAFLIQFDFHINRLICYGAFYFIANAITLVIYIAYSRKLKYTTIRKFYFNNRLFKEMGTFSGWNMLGACASMSATQGLNILINMFYGVALNAAYGIAVQIQGAVSNIIFNFQKASNPQIVKSYSEKNLLRTKSLIINVSKFSLLLTIAFAVPMIINIDFILKMWLGSSNIPPNTAQFAVWTLVLLILISFSGPIDTAILATGKIRKFQIAYSIIIFSNIILAYICFKVGMPPIYAIITKCIVELFVIAVRAWFIQHKIGLSIGILIKEIMAPTLTISVISICSIIIFIRFTKYGGGMTNLICTTTIYLLILVICSWFIALNQNQRKLIWSAIKAKLHNTFKS